MLPVRFHLASYILLLFAVCSCKGPDIQLTRDRAPDFILSMNTAIRKAISDQTIPGAVLVVEMEGKKFQELAYGYRTLEPSPIPMTPDTLFDLASLSKVLGTATATQLLVEDEKLSLNTQVSEIIPDFAQNGKATITIEQLLTHTSGLPPYVFWQTIEENRGNTPRDQAVIEWICSSELNYQPGKKYCYSCLNYLILARVNETIAGESQHKLLRRRVWKPLGMKDTTYFPSSGQLTRLAPVFPSRSKHKEVEIEDVLSHYYADHNAGDINDSLACYYSVSKKHCPGNAGLFSTVKDVSIYARMILGEGMYHGVRVFKKETIRQMTTLHASLPDYKNNLINSRGLGWVNYTQAPYFHPAMEPGSAFGHTGYTGTFLYIDQASQSYLILLTNAVHLNPYPNVNPLRGAITRSLVEDLYGSWPVELEEPFGKAR